MGRFGGFDLPIPLGWLGAALAAGFVSFLIGALTIRLRADYLAIATFGVAVTVQLIALNLEPVTGGPFGIGFIPRPFQGQAGDPLLFSALNLGVLAATVVILYLALERLLRSPWGRVLRAIREDETAALALGKSAVKFRLQAFAIGGGIMGLAGAAQAHFIGFIAPDNYQPMLTFQVWAMLIVGGSGNNRGAILGAVLVWGIWAGSAGAVADLFPAGQQARAAALQIVMIGVALCAILLLRPRGILGEEQVVSRHLGKLPLAARPPSRPSRKQPARRPPMLQIPDRIALAGGLSMSRLICGLWQVADLEKDGTTLDPERGADALEAYAAAGFDTFDMADHYGSAELIAGRLLARYREPRRAAARLHQMVPGARADDRGNRACRRPAAARPARRRSCRPAAVPLVDVRASGMARRDARNGAAPRRRSDRSDRRHQFRRSASGAGAGRRRAARHQPGFVLARRPPRRGRAVAALPRQGRQASGLWHAVRRLSRRQMAGPPRTNRDRRLEPLEIQALHRCGRRLGRLPGHSAAQPARSPGSMASRSPMSRRAGCSSTRRSPRRSSARASARASTAPTI